MIVMGSEPTAKPTESASSKTARMEVKGIRIFSYPKVIYLFPTLVVALICGIAMTVISDRTEDPTKAPAAAQAGVGASATNPAVPAKHERFTTLQNLCAVLFLGVFAFNLLTMAVDFPRFTILGMVLLAAFLIFFVLWIGAAFDVELMRWVRSVMASIYVYANAEFYFMIAVIEAVIFAIVYATRFLDYWQIMPNEILHHHGPLSDLERYPTMNLKFDKEIPDVLEFMLLGAGRLVLHVTDERKAIVLDNVLFINSVEASLKNLMSRMEVRITTDQEVAGI
jgi:hypothetical protein